MNKELYEKMANVFKDYVDKPLIFDEAEIFEIYDLIEEEEIREKISFYLENYRDEVLASLELDDIDFISKYCYSDDWKELFRKYLTNIDLLKKRIRTLLERKEKEDE